MMRPFMKNQRVSATKNILKNVQDLKDMSTYANPSQIYVRGFEM
jgi:hypothetical protein